MKTASRTKKTKKPKAPGEFDSLLQALRDLNSQSAFGFEGFIRDALAFIAQRTLRLVKSGPQEGSDFTSEDDALLTGIAFEAKRFNAATSLPQDELESKLHQAANTRKVDLWGVVLSREMREPDWSNLKQIGAGYGISLICLDWREAPDNLPPLAAICAGARHIAEARLGMHLSPLLDVAKSHPSFSRQIAEIRQQLNNPEVGFDLARDAANKSLLKVLASPNQARDQLHGHADILSEDAGLVSRQAVIERLNAWWDSGGYPPAALLGDEGRGKTWAALDWCVTRQSDGEPPMILIASAKSLFSGDPTKVLSGLLAECMPVDETVLVRRLLRWLRDESPAQILLVIDGLNERWSFDWSEFVRRFNLAPWRGRVSLLMTSRTGYWHNDLLELKGATSEPVLEIPVPDFTDSEVDAYLSARELTRADIPRSLIQFQYIPRFAKLVISLRHRWKDADGLTIADLVMEDWQARLEHRGGDLHVNVSSLREFISGLGKEVLQNPEFTISEKQIHERLSGDSGRDLEHYRIAINEITEGHWLTATGRPHRYKVNLKLLPYVIGLDLANTLEDTATETAAQEIIAQYQEQLRGADIGVAILRAAACFLLAQKHGQSGARTALLKAWIGAQNFTALDFNEFWPLINRDIELFLDIAEAHWKEYPLSSGEGEVLAKGLANADKWPNVHQLLVARLPRWVGAFGSEPVEWQYRNRISGSDERRQMTQARLQEWQEVQTLYTRQIADHLRQDEWDHLPQAAFGIISMIERAPYIETFVTWAVTRAIMGRTIRAEQFEWLLRLKSEDHAAFKTAVLDEVAILSQLPGTVGKNAGDILIDGLATVKTPLSGSSPFPSTIRRPPWWPYLDADHVVVWPEPGDAAEPATLRLVERLSPFAPNPSAKLSRVDETRVMEVGKKAPDASHTDIASKELQLALARWDPVGLGTQIRQVYAELSGQQKRSELHWLNDIEENLFILSEDERHALLIHGREALQRLRTSGPAPEANSEHPFHTMIVAGIIGLSASAQIEELAGLLPRFRFSRSLAATLAPPTRKDVETIFERLATETNESVIDSWLGYLNQVTLPQSLPHNGHVLIDLLKHESSDIRGQALRVILDSEDAELGKAVVDTGWTIDQGKSRLEAICGTLIISRFARDQQIEALTSRITSQAIPHLVETRGKSADEVRIAFDYVLGMLDQKLARSVNERGGYEYRFKTNDIWRMIVEMDGGIVQRKLVELARRGDILGFFDTLPVVELLTAIMETEPEEGVVAWNSIKETHREYGMKVADFDQLPFLVSDSDALTALRQAVLDHAKNDSELADVAYWSLAKGHKKWLLRVVETGLGDGNGGDVARALTLAGYFDDDEDGDGVWSDQIDALTLTGWLADVRDIARRRFTANRHARHWFEQFLTASSHDEAFGYLKLLYECMDNRSSLWMRGMVNRYRRPALENRLKYLGAVTELRRSTMKKRSEDRRKTLYGTKIAFDVWPWF